MTDTRSTSLLIPNLSGETLPETRGTLRLDAPVLPLDRLSRIKIATICVDCTEVPEYIFENGPNLNIDTTDPDNYLISDIGYYVDMGNGARSAAFHVLAPRYETDLAYSHTNPAYYYSCRQVIAFLEEYSEVDVQGALRLRAGYTLSPRLARLFMPRSAGSLAFNDSFKNAKGIVVMTSLHVDGELFTSTTTGAMRQLVSFPIMRTFTSADPIAGHIAQFSSDALYNTELMKLPPTSAMPVRELSFEIMWFDKEGEMHPIKMHVGACSFIKFTQVF